MGRPKGSKDKGKRVRRFYRDPQGKKAKKTPGVVASPAKETKTLEPILPLDGGQTPNPTTETKEGVTAPET